jgi:hypothetical protein
MGTGNKKSTQCWDAAGLKGMMGDTINKDCVVVVLWVQNPSKCLKIIKVF